MRLKDFEIFEAATAGATTSGNIATVANPHVAHSKQKPKKVKPTDNALDMDVPLLSSKNPATIRRRIQEGSLYKNEELVEAIRIEPRGEEGKANAFKRAMANVAKNKETRAINSEKSKRQTAQAAGYDAIVGGKDISKIARPDDTNAGMKDSDYKTPPGSKRAPEFVDYESTRIGDSPRIRPGFSPARIRIEPRRTGRPDPDQSKGGIHKWPDNRERAWTRHLEKELKKRLGGRKPL